MITKSRLKNNISKHLLESEFLMAKLGDMTDTQVQSIRNSLKREAQILCLPHYQNAIREVLGLTSDEEITEIYTPEIIAE